MTTAWFHCFAGVAGDMALGALVDAGADLDEVEALCRRVAVPGWEIEAEPVLRSGLGATKVRVLAPPEPDGHRRWRDIAGLLRAAGLPARVEARASSVFALLAAAEGATHRVDPGDVHFHEVGSVDAIVDVVGVCSALEVLGVDHVCCSPIAVGRGTVRSAHGMLPNPAPATVRILAAAGAPTHGVDSPVELTTPTGAALMAGLASGFGPLPSLELSATGFGAGGSDPDGLVNATQVILGRAVGPAPERIGGAQPVVVLETNVDDATGEVLADAVAALLAAGALDAWLTPVVMKKGRPAHTVSVLADPALAGDLAGLLRSSTGSLGVRGTTLDRWPASRSIEDVDIDAHRIRVKVSPGRIKAEHDDVTAAAAATGRPATEVAARAEAAVAGRRLREEGPAPPADGRPS